MLGALFGMLLASATVFTADGRLSDPALEIRAEHLGDELRCLVCESATIEDFTGAAGRRFAAARPRADRRRRYRPADPNTSC